jgi:uncharacterized protein HemX
VQLTPLSTHWAPRKKNKKKGTIFFGHLYLLTAIGLTPGGISTVHIYTQTIHRTTKKNKQYIEQHKKQYIEQHKKTIHRTTQKKQYIEQHKNKLEQCGSCPVLVTYTLAFALQLRKKHGKTSVMVAEQ